MRLFVFVLALFLVSGCKDQASTKSNVNERAIGETDSVETARQELTAYDPATVDDALAEEIALRLQEMFSAELEIMTADDRNFRMYKLNMDQDPAEEVFVLFMSPYFCGSAGCNLLLLDDDLSRVTRFTVTRPPLFIEPSYKNDWRIILVKSEGEWKELAFDGQSYPSNPSVVPKAPYDAPSGHAVVMFSNQEPYLSAKVYGF